MTIINFEEDDLNNEGSGFLGTGVHDVTITEVEEKTSQSGNEMLVLTLEDKTGRTCREYMVYSVRWKFAQLGKALGLSTDDLITHGLDTNFIGGKTIAIERYQDGVRKSSDGKEYPNIQTKFLEPEEEGDYEGEDIPY